MGGGEGVTELGGDFLEGLGQDAGGSEDGHEIGVALPTGHDVEVEVFDDAGSGHPAEVESDIESIGAQGLAQGIHAAAGQLHQFEHFVVGEIGEVGDLAVGNDHEMAAVVGVIIEQGIARPAAGEHEVGFVLGGFGDLSEHRGLVGGCFGGADILDAPRRVELVHVGGSVRGKGRGRKGGEFRVGNSGFAGGSGRIKLGAMKGAVGRRDQPLVRPPLARMMHIHSALQVGDHPNATRLAGELEVSTKTVHRDLEFMRDRMGLPIVFDAVRNGYGYSEEVEAFPTLQICEGELFALLVAEKALQQYRGTPFEGRLVSALRKLEQALPDTVSLNLGEWDRSISFRTSAEPMLGLPVLETLFEAIQQRRQLRLQYRKPGAPVAEERVVDPYHLANVNGDWYLFAYDQRREALRTFVPARIQAATATGTLFRRPARFELARQLEDSFGVFSKEGDYEVVVVFEERVADYIREKRWHPSQELKELSGGGVEIRLRLGSLVEVERWVLGWGGAACVVGPETLVARVRAAAGRLMAGHGGTDFDK